MNSIYSRSLSVQLHRHSEHYVGVDNSTLQAKVRTTIRVKENRARPIDILSKNLLLDHNFDMEFTEPYRVFRGLPTVSYSYAAPFS